MRKAWEKLQGTITNQGKNMTEKDIQEAPDEGLELARRLAEEEEGVGRRPKGPTRFVIPTIAVAWSLFQLSIASWLIIDSTFIRAIHLAFALVIVFLNYPVLKHPRFGLKFLAIGDRIPLIDYFIAAPNRSAQPIAKALRDLASAAKGFVRSGQQRFLHARSTPKPSKNGIILNVTKTMA